MTDLEIAHLLGLLALMLAGAKILGGLAQRIGQPPVLGELTAGVLLGATLLGWIKPDNEMLHGIAELGVVILLFEIGLETDLHQLLRLGGAATAVALAGVIVPFVLGYAVCHFLGLPNMESVVAGAALTATSVGITARVLNDLGRLQEPESQVILGAAVLDDLVGLVILTVVSGLTQGDAITLGSVARITALAFGFLAVVLVIGSYLFPIVFGFLGRNTDPASVRQAGIITALAMAWLAAEAGSAILIGAFAAGLLIRRTAQFKEIEHHAVRLGQFFVPIFFVMVGAAVDLRLFNPFNPENKQTLIVGSLLLLVAIIGKFVAGYTPFWMPGKKSVIGVGMIPRGEVGFIFAQMGLAKGILDRGLFSAIALMVMVTTFMAPPLLKWLFPPRPVGGTPSCDQKHLKPTP